MRTLFPKTQPKVLQTYVGQAMWMRFAQFWVQFDSYNSPSKPTSKIAWFVRFQLYVTQRSLETGVNGMLDKCIE